MLSPSALWQDLMNTLDNPRTLSAFAEYYRALASWILRHEDSFGEQLAPESALSYLIGLDPERHLAAAPELSLELERARLASILPETVDDVAGVVHDTLLDLVTIWAPGECPNCEGPMRMMAVEESLERRLLVRCRDCGHQEWADGKPVMSPPGKLVPATRDEIGLEG